jgi:DNA mismatch endonuclease, patch repair protein
VDRLSREQRSANMRAVKSKNTGPELLARSAAHRLGLRFRLHRSDLPGSPDLVFAKHRVVIFVHGCFWHGHPGCRRATVPKTNSEFWHTKVRTNRLRDRRSSSRLKKLGWRVIILWQCQIRTLDSAIARLSSEFRRELRRTR